MTKLTRSRFIEEANGQIPDNSKGMVRPVHIRERLINLADSVYFKDEDPLPSVRIGTVKTGAPGSPAEASMTGELLNLTIPTGAPGPSGELATQAEAETGADVIGYMNPLRTKQAIQELGAEGLYSRDGGLTRRPLRDLRRDWTTLYEQDAACDGIANDWPAFEKALASGLKINLEGKTYLVNPPGTIVIPANTGLIVGDGRALIRTTNASGIFMSIDGDADGKCAKLNGFKIKGPWTRDKAIVSGHYGIYAQKTVWNSGTDYIPYWFFGMDWDGVEVEGFGARGFHLTMVADGNLRRLVARNCGTHGFLGQGMIGGRQSGLSKGIGELSAPMATNRYGHSLARPSVYGGTGVMATCPMSQDVTVEWRVEDLEMYFAFDAHSGARITYRDCSTANVGAMMNIEHSNQADEANCEDITFEGGHFLGLNTVTGAYKPGPLLFVDSAIAGKTQKARNINLRHVTAKGFGFMGSNIDGPNGGWGGVIAAQGVDGLSIEDVEITSGYGPAVLLYSPAAGSDTHFCRNVRIDNLRYHNPVNPLNYLGGDPGGSWKDPYLVQIDSAEVDLSIENSTLLSGSYSGFMRIDPAAVNLAMGGRIHVGTNNRAASAVLGSANRPVFYRAKDAVKVSSGAGSPLGARGRAWIVVSGGTISSGSTLPPGWTAAYESVGSYVFTVPAGTYEYDNLPIRLIGGGAAVDRMQTATISATQFRVLVYNSSNALFDPTEFQFELWGPPGGLGT